MSVDTGDTGRIQPHYSPCDDCTFVDQIHRTQIAGLSALFFSGVSRRRAFFTVSERLFSPGSIAVVGASARPSPVGQALLRNLRTANFNGTIALINPRYREIGRSPGFAPSSRCKNCRSHPTWW
jgi:hypothetical protein